jgi:predicted nucleotidyltransferase
MLSQPRSVNEAAARQKPNSYQLVIRHSHIGLLVMAAATEPPWAVTPEKLREAVRRLVDAADPRRIILFGSRARGDAHEDSDLDLLIVLAEVKDRVAEMVRLTRVLRGLMLPAELLVVSQTMFDDWSELPGTVYYDARREGQILYDAS